MMVVSRDRSWPLPSELPPALVAHLKVLLALHVLTREAEAGACKHGRQLCTLLRRHWRVVNVVEAQEVGNAGLAQQLQAKAKELRLLHKQPASKILAVIAVERDVDGEGWERL